MLKKKVSKKWLKMYDVYMSFADKSNTVLDFSDNMSIEMYNHESRGFTISSNNGFYWGKHNLDLTLKMWIEDVANKTLLPIEILNDEKFPLWWRTNMYNMLIGNKK